VGEQVIEWWNEQVMWKKFLNQKSCKNILIQHWVKDFSHVRTRWESSVSSTTWHKSRLLFYMCSILWYSRMYILLWFFLFYLI